MMTKQFFRRINLITLVAVYALILVGAIVRSTGAGMGCPDWPKCFGAYAPPASVTDLPENYKDVFLQERLKKNERLANMLSKLGMQKLAARVQNDPLVRITEDFSVTKAWIEYGNRLVGVLIGFLVFLSMIASFSYRRDNPTVMYVAIGVFILTGFQGWVGSLVVSTNLLPGFLTFHMLLALLIVALIIYNYHRAGDTVSVTPKSSKLKWVLLGFGILLVPQIAFGVNIREQVDLLLMTGTPRTSVVISLDTTFLIHRSYSWLLAGLGAWAWWLLRGTPQARLGLAMLLLIFTEVLIGVGLAYFGLPNILQPLHLLTASLLFGVGYYGWLHVK
jgi:heme a synthase